MLQSEFRKNPGGTAAGLRHDLFLIDAGEHTVPVNHFTIDHIEADVRGIGGIEEIGQRLIHRLEMGLVQIVDYNVRPAAHLQGAAVGAALGQGAVAASSVPAAGGAPGRWDHR